MQRQLCENVNASPVRVWTHGQLSTLITGVQSSQLHIPSNKCEIKPTLVASLRISQKYRLSALPMHTTQEAKETWCSCAAAYSVDPPPLLGTHPRSVALDPPLASVCTSRSPTGIKVGGKGIRQEKKIRHILWVFLNTEML